MSIMARLICTKYVAEDCDPVVFRKKASELLRKGAILDVSLELKQQ